MNTYNTGYVSGMTGLTRSTIQRYIKKYRDCFSAEASKPSTGRRFTDQDINTLLTIKQMTQAREDPQTIRAALKADAPTATLSALDRENMIQIAHAAREAMLETQRLAEQVQTQYLIISRTMSDQKIRNKKIEEVITEQNQRIYQIEIKTDLKRARQEKAATEKPDPLDPALRKRSLTEKITSVILGTPF